MSPKCEAFQIRCTWTNGEKAVVRLIEYSDGARQIQKVYKPGFTKWMFREYISIRYVSKRLDIVPKFIGFRPWKKEIVISYVPGQRVLEWVLAHFGEPNLDLDQFVNCESLTDRRILDAFDRFRGSSSTEAVRLRESIKMSYEKLHRIGWQHGTSDPRNVIYDGQRAYIIDFDHARPSLSPTRFDHPALKDWFGITYENSTNAN